MARLSFLTLLLPMFNGRTARKCCFPLAYCIKLTSEGRREKFVPEAACAVPQASGDEIFLWMYGRML